MPEPPTTLVVMPNWVGDVVMALPTVAALAASGRALALLAKPHLLPLLRELPGVAELIERTSDEATLARLAAPGGGARHAEAVVLPQSFHAAFLPSRAGIPYRWGYRSRPTLDQLAPRPWPHLGRFLESLLVRPWRDLLLHPAVALPRRPCHQSEEPRALLEAMGVPPPVSWQPQLPLSPTVRQAGAERLARAHLRLGDGPLVGLFPGAEFGPSKRWPWPRFAELARALRRALPALQATIVAGPNELWTAVRVHEESGKLHPVIGPDLDLAGLAGVLAHLDLLVTNDSGPMHLAAALGVPCVALFGPTDPARTRPLGARHVVVSQHRWCAPCFRRRCPLFHHRCLRQVTVERVAAACVEVTRRPRDE